MSSETLNLIVGILYASVIILAPIFIFWVTLQKKKNIEAMKKNINEKLSSEIELSSKDIVHIGKAFNLSSYEARKIVYKIYSNVNEKKAFSELKKLITEIETEEPFDDLPDEVKPSMVRLTKLTSESEEDSDKHLLSPIVQVLNKYVELTTEQAKLKKQANKAYIITLVSFIIGGMSFYFTIMSPSALEIAQEIQKQNSQQIEQPVKAIESDR